MKPRAKPKPKALRLLMTAEQDAKLRTIMSRMLRDPDRHPRVNKQAATMYAIEIAAGVAEG